MNDALISFITTPSFLRSAIALYALFIALYMSHQLTRSDRYGETWFGLASVLCLIGAVICTVLWALIGNGVWTSCR